MKKVTLFLIASITLLDSYTATYLFNNNQNISIINGKVFIDGKEVPEIPAQEATAAEENSSENNGTVIVDDNGASITVNVTGSNLVVLGHVTLSMQGQSS